MATCFLRKIKCARHYLLKPGCTGFFMERIPALRNISHANAKSLGIQLYRRKKGRDGQPIQNFADYYQPDVSATEMKLRVYDPLHHICQKCKRCVTA